VANPKIRKIALGCLGVLGLVIAVVVVLALMQPDTYRVSVSRDMSAPPEAIEPLVTDMREWAAWNPWAEIDPNATLEFSDPAAGEGAWYTWKGNEDMGSGKMTVISVADSQVEYDLEFIEPFAGHADVAIAWEPSGDDTAVTWSMEGENTFGSKVASLFMDFQGAIEKDFEDGLANLDAAATRQ